MKAARALMHAWLVLDFFGDARRRGGASSTLTTTIFTQAFLALAFAALMYPETPPVPFAAANLSLSSLFVAITALGDQDRLERRRADQALVGTSPASPWLLLLARTGHAAFYVGLVTVGMALSPAILLAKLTTPLTGIAYVLLACVCSGLCAGALAVLVRALARMFGEARAALLAGTLKALVLGAAIALFALGLQALRATADALPIGRLGAELLPSYHAARVLAYPATEAWRLLVLAGSGALLALLWLLCGSHAEDRASRPATGGPLGRLLAAIAGQGPRRGIADFVAAHIWRSPGFRARVLPLLGLPAGMVYLTLRGGTDEHGFVFLCVLLQLPTIYLPFLIAFLPRADQENTRWLFDHAPGLTPAIVRDATWRALVTHVLLPVHCTGLALLAVLAPDHVGAAAAAVFAFAVGVLAARWLVRALRAMPFTEDGNSDVPLELGQLFPLAVGLLAVGIGFGQFLGPVSRWGAAVAALGAAVLALRAPAPAVAATGFGGSAGQDLAQPDATPTDEATEPPRPAPTLGRELKAIAVLYVALMILPLVLAGILAD